MANQVCKNCRYWQRVEDAFGFCSGWPPTDRLLTTLIGTTLQNSLYRYTFMDFTCNDRDEAAYNKWTAKP